MNVVMIGPFAFKPKSTVSVRAFFMARALVKRGHQVTILMPPYDNPADSGRTWEKDGARLENMRLARNGIWDQFTVPLAMARRAVKLGADVVHAFKPMGYSGLAAMVIRRMSRLPLVLDTDDWEGRGGWADINHYPWAWQHLFDWQERWLAQNADVITVASRTLEGQVTGFGADPSHVFYLPNGPDDGWLAMGDISREQKKEAREALGIGESPFALYLGNVPHGSDLDLAVDALAMLQATLPEAKLVIAGVGPGIKDLQAMVMSVGLTKSVLFPGWIDPAEAPIYVSAADVAINPYRDTLINRSKCAGKIIMAMAMGTPVITSRLGENLAYIQNEHSGLLTPPGDATAIGEALLAVFSNRDWAHQLGDHGRRRIWSEYAWDPRISQVEAAYELAQGRRS